MKKLIAILLTLVMVMGLAACVTVSTDEKKEEIQTDAAEEAAGEASDAAAIPGLEDGVLTISMECAYAPYNWTQYDDSNGAVPIKDAAGEYVNGYDVMIAKKICEANGWELEVVRSDWDSL
ncbi:MAG: ABC transporter substrate-binding protein, partial [Lachnospiraceae bacterium]|nr:ABC transporter substrate-binding protein [Lachnospiraceae bacterium]